MNNTDRQKEDVFSRDSALRLFRRRRAVRPRRGHCEEEGRWILELVSLGSGACIVRSRYSLLAGHYSPPHVLRIDEEESAT